MLIILLHAATGVVLAVWGLLRAELGFGALALAGIVVLALSLAALGAVLARRALPAAAGHLRWDGQVWCWVAPDGRAEPPLARLEIALQLGPWALLRLHPAAGGQTFWRIASARAAGAAWHGLCVALAAHAGAPPEHRPQPPGA